MFSFFKRKSQASIPVPPSMGFFSEAEYGDFVAAVEAYFKPLKVAITWQDGAIEAGPNDLGLAKLGLTNVGQGCKRAGRQQYATVIAGHFDAMVRSHKFQQEFDAIVEDFEQVKRYIGVRIYAEDYFPAGHRDKMMGRLLAPGIYAMMVFDLPDAVINILPTVAAKWGRSDAELFDLGVRNIRQNYQFEVIRQPLDGTMLYLCHGDHFFVPNLILDLQNRKELVGPFGAIVGLPTRHLAAIFPITGLDVLQVISKMTAANLGLYEQGPGAVSDQLYWYHDGEITHFPVRMEGEKMQIFPPEAFVEVLNQLGE